MDEYLAIDHVPAYEITCMENFTQSADCSHSNDTAEYYKAVVRRLWLVYPPVVLFVGTIGNILCFFVTRRHSLRRSSVGLCLSVLALSDLMVLYTGITRNWTVELFEWDIRNVHESLCKLQRFALYFSLDFSAWALVTLTVERFISVCYPFHAARLCTRSTTKKIFLLIALIICVENIGVFIVKGREYQTIGNTTFVTKECGYTSATARYYWQHVRPWCVISLYAVIPFTIMIVCGIRIVIRLYKAKQAMSRLPTFKNATRSPSMSRSSVKHANGHSVKGAPSLDMQLNLASIKMQSVTIMTVVIAFVFLLLVTPSHLEFFLERYWDKNEASDFATYRIIEASSRTLLYTNHAISFFVYCASGKQFRQEFIAMVTRKKSSRSQSYHLNTRSSTYHVQNSPAVIRRSMLTSV